MIPLDACEIEVHGVAENTKTRSNSLVRKEKAYLGIIPTNLKIEMMRVLVTCVGNLIPLDVCETEVHGVAEHKNNEECKESKSVFMNHANQTYDRKGYSLSHVFKRDSVPRDA